MRRREINEEDEPLIEQDGEEPDTQKGWNIFRNNPRKIDSGSTAESKFIDTGVKCLKCFTVIFTYCVVLGMGVLSKGTLLFMTSQIRNITRPYCNKDIEVNQQFQVNLPTEERVVWMWLIIFAYMVPDLGTFLRSVRIVCFKSWEYPNQWKFLSVFITETLPPIGSAILVFVIFPELDVIKAAMLTNAVCIVPAFVGFLSRNPHSFNSTLKVVLDVFAIVAQASAFVIWPLLTKQNILYLIPVSLILISFGWWENFLSEKSPIKVISEMAIARKHLKNDSYFMYAFIAPWKCLVFLITTVIILVIQGEAYLFLFSNFQAAFQSHSINITETGPNIAIINASVDGALASGYGTVIETSIWTPLSVFLINIISTFLCYAFGKFACKIMIQSFGFALPINLVVPVLLTALIAVCGNYNKDECAYADTIPAYLFFNTPSVTDLNNFIAYQHSWIWLVWLLSQCWITVHIWKNNNEKLASTEKLFFRPMYDAYLIDQSIALNRRRVVKEKEIIVREDEENEELQQDSNKDSISRIYACGTMWHETKEEMLEFLKSILRMDEDQCAHRIVRNYLQYYLPNYYEFETHILFDDAFVRTSQDDPDPHVNQYVLDLIDSVAEAAKEVHRTTVRIKTPVIYPTPYGGRLVWTLPGKTKMIAHLKDKAKIRAKKRWSQVMYMYYLLGHRIMENDTLTPERAATISENTYLLALDGDIDFQPHAVHLLVDYMKKNKTLGAACGRIHPIGSGTIAWYQVFEYAVGHWLQKATEHVIGCVLCSPGCFSLFRAKALMDDNVMAKYTTVSTEARHYVQYDQGEDRWLCTLLLQRGYRVEYSAASDAYTHCPEGFNEFYNQRRRWMPSTTANILDLLTDYKHIIKVNDNISLPYIFYQFILMLGTAIGPGTIFLMLVGAFVAAFRLDQWSSFAWNIVPILIFVIVCATCSADTQLFFAGVISALYGLVMMAVLIGIFMQIQDDGFLAPSSLFFFCVGLEFIITAIMHPQEFYCLKYGVIYYVTVPSMYMLLVIYSIFNMNNVSWGTREVTIVPKPQEQKGAKKEEEKDKKEEKKPEKKHKIYSFFGRNRDNAGSFEFSCAGLFKIFCCTHQIDGEENQMLKNIQTSLVQMQQKLDYIERNQTKPATEPIEQRRTTARRTTFIEGARASRAPSIRNSTFGLKSSPEELEEEYDEDSVLTPSDDVQENSWFYDGDLIRSEVAYLERKEEKFWTAVIEKYLQPIDDTNKKEKIAKDLKDLRDKMVITFFMINALFVLVVFLLTLQKELLHVNWPIAPKVNFTYYHDQNEIHVQKTYLELEPIGFVFLVFFALLMLVQFGAMFFHRFGTYSQIMANTIIDWDLFKSSKVKNLTEDQILENDPVKIFKKLMKLEGLNDADDDDADAPVTRRNTVHTLAINKKNKKPVITDLDKAFSERMRNINPNTKKLPIPRKTLMAIEKRRETVQRRKSQLPQMTNIPQHFKNLGNENVNVLTTFDDPPIQESQT